MLLRSLCTGLLLLGLLACDGPEEGEEVTLLPAGAYLYGCGDWSPEPPPASWSAFDIPAWGTQKDSVTAAIEAVGGWTVGTFNAPKVRVVAPVTAIPALYDQEVVDDQPMTQTVTDTLDRTVRFGVMFADSTTVADIRSVTGLGVSVVHVWTSISGIVVDGQDSLLPVISALPRVVSVEGGIATLQCMPFSREGRR
jgi:hypothetical protein